MSKLLKEYSAKAHIIDPTHDLARFYTPAYQAKEAPKGFVARMMAAVGRAIDDATVYEVPKHLVAKAMSFEAANTVKIITDLTSVTGVKSERDVHIQLSPENYQHLWDMTVVHTHLLANDEKITSEALTTALGKTRGAFTGASAGIAPATIRLAQVAGLNAMLSNLEITVEDHGWKRGGEIATLRTSDNLQGAVRFTGMGTNPNFKDAGAKVHERFAHGLYKDESPLSKDTRDILIQQEIEMMSQRHKPLFPIPTLSIG